MDKGKFLAARKSLHNHKGIGTLGEKTLHSVLKNYYEEHTENHEIKVGGYVADIVGENGIIEIQTRNFDKLRKKLTAFLEVCDVTIVYPVAQIKWLCWVDTKSGEITKKRKSNKKGIPHEIFHELYKIKEFLDNPRLKIIICMLELEEYRLLNGWSEDRKKGSTRSERIPVEIIDEIIIENIIDYKRLIPEGLTSGFSAKDFSMLTKLSINRAQTALNILNHVHAVNRISKKGNAYIYKINDETSD